MDQIDGEIKNTLELIKDTYNVFGINEIEFYLSTRPEDKFIGEIETWDIAESQLKNVLNSTAGEGNGLPEKVMVPLWTKIDVLLKDAFNKKHQVGTIQLDFQLPNRFELKYVGEDGKRDHQPILVHRAVLDH